MTATRDFSADVKKANERALELMRIDPTISNLLGAGKIDRLTGWRMAIGIAVAEIRFPDARPSGAGAADVSNSRARDEAISAKANDLLESDPKLKVLARTDRATAYKQAIRAAVKEISA